MRRGVKRRRPLTAWVWAFGCCEQEAKQPEPPCSVCVCGLEPSVSKHSIPKALGNLALFLALLFLEEGYSWDREALGSFLVLCMS